jgi:hypothetical protein
VQAGKTIIILPNNRLRSLCGELFGSGAHRPTLILCSRLTMQRTAVSFGPRNPCQRTISYSDQRQTNSAGVGKESLMESNQMLRRPLFCLAALITPSSSYAYTDCQVTLATVFTRDIGGSWQYALWLNYTYITTTGTSVSSSGSVLLTNPAAANISAAAFAARVSGQTNVSVRFLNTGGASVDAVCGPPGRGDLIGFFLNG